MAQPSKKRKKPVQPQAPARPPQPAAPPPQPTVAPTLQSVPVDAFSHQIATPPSALPGIKKDIDKILADFARAGTVNVDKYFKANRTPAHIINEFRRLFPDYKPGKTTEWNEKKGGFAVAGTKEPDPKDDAIPPTDWSDVKVPKIDEGSPFAGMQTGTNLANFNPGAAPEWQGFNIAENAKAGENLKGLQWDQSGLNSTSWRAEDSQAVPMFQGIANQSSQSVASLNNAANRLRERTSGMMQGMMNGAKQSALSRGLGNSGMLGRDMRAAQGSAMNAYAQGMVGLEDKFEGWRQQGLQTALGAAQGIQGDVENRRGLSQLDLSQLRGQSENMIKSRNQFGLDKASGIDRLQSDDYTASRALGQLENSQANNYRQSNYQYGTTLDQSTRKYRDELEWDRNKTMGNDILARQKSNQDISWDSEKTRKGDQTARALGKGGLLEALLRIVQDNKGNPLI